MPTGAKGQQHVVRDVADHSFAPSFMRRRISPRLKTACSNALVSGIAFPLCPFAASLVAAIIAFTLPEPDIASAAFEMCLRGYANRPERRPPLETFDRSLRSEEKDRGTG
jgi:hypothetical protein